MYCKPIGISILTNGNRLSSLQQCLESLIANCYYRPIHIFVFDNGSTDDTWDWLTTKELGYMTSCYGVKFHVEHSDVDLGCAAGTNRAIQMTNDCEYGLHIESDFELLKPEESGEDRLWLRRAVEFMEQEGANYLYLRRITGEYEMMQHWWSQWMKKITSKKGSYLYCPDFWWTNNPALRKNKALYENGTLPLDVAKDGAKGTDGWSQPELCAKAPGKAWIHQWGVFVHEKSQQSISGYGCGLSSGFGKSTCKYGFLNQRWSEFCSTCDKRLGFSDMAEHEKRFRKAVGG